MGPKLILDLRISTSLGNGGPSCKGYKMRCLRMPLFWFVSFFDGTKRIRDKIFCFDIRLEPNPYTRHTSHRHREGCNSKELRGIRMSEFPPLLLGKRAMTGSLSQNLFCQLQGKGEWLTILESLKRKIDKANSHNHQPNKQGVLLRA